MILLLVPIHGLELDEFDSNIWISDDLAVFAHVNYVQSFGSKFGNKPSKFQIEEVIPDNTKI